MTPNSGHSNTWCKVCQVALSKQKQKVFQTSVILREHLSSVPQAAVSDNRSFYVSGKTYGLTWLATVSFLPMEDCVGEDPAAWGALAGARFPWGRNVEKKLRGGVERLTGRWLDTRSLCVDRTHTNSDYFYLSRHTHTHTNYSLIWDHS